MIEEFMPVFHEGEPWSAKYVEENLGIRERRSCFRYPEGILESGYSDSDKAMRACLLAMQDAGLQATEIDYLIYVTSTPDYLYADPACALHARLGMRDEAGALGPTAVGCGGFVYGLHLANALIRSGAAQNVMVVGSMTVGPYVNATHEDDNASRRQETFKKYAWTPYLFGEGAGAMILQASDDEDHGITDIAVGATGHNNPFRVEGGGSRNPTTLDTVRRGLHHFELDLPAIMRIAPKLLLKAINRVLAMAELKIPDIDYFVFHQINVRILEMVARRAGIPWECMAVHVNRYGNLNTASVPVAYTEALADKRIRPGDRVVIAAVGAGWQYGAAVIKA